MGGRKQQLQDASICMGISGCEDIEHTGISIVEDYFKREYEENRRESGLSIEINEDLAPRSEREIGMWLNDKNLSDLEQARTNRVMMEYPRDEVEDVGIKLPSSRVTETV